MRKIDAKTLTKSYRSKEHNLALVESTYRKAIEDYAHLQYWNNPVLDNFDGIVLQPLCNLLLWTNKEIFLKIPESVKTLEVKIRIATGMLNKIKYLSKDQKILLHNNLVNSTNWLKTEWIVFDYANHSDLPF